MTNNSCKISALDWICPNCAAPLSLSARSWFCLNHHQFDVAKAGYVNLLLANQKASKQPGDSQDMLKARQAFLLAGYYDPLVQLLVKHLTQITQNKLGLSLLDIGCGEGYYLKTLLPQLASIAASAGMDIAKGGLQLASKSYNGAQWVCASNARVPLADHSVDLITRIFAPSNDMEIRRILKNDGYFLVVSPGSHHLFELKEAIYDQVRLHEPIKAPEGFIEVNKEELRYSMEFANTEDFLHLLKMTPFYWTGNQSKKDLLLTAKPFVIQAHFILTSYQAV